MNPTPHIPILLLVLTSGAVQAPAQFPYRVEPLTPVVQAVPATDTIFTVSPAIAVQTGGDWMNVWAENDEEFFFDAYFTVYNAQTDTLSEIVKVNRDATQGQVLDGPRIAAIGNDRYVVAWIDDIDPFENQINYDVRFALFDVEGRKLTDDLYGFEPFITNQPSEDVVHVHDINVAAAANQTLCLVWTDDRDFDPDTGIPFYDILGRRFYSQGDHRDSAEFMVNLAFEDTTPRNPVVAAGEDGDYLIAWSDDRVRVDDGGTITQRFDIYCRRVPGNWTRPGDIETYPVPMPPTTERPVSYDDPNAPPAHMEHAGLPAAAGGDGVYLIAWQNDSPWDHTTDIYASLRDREGRVLTPTFLVSAELEEAHQTQPAVAHIGNGRFLVVWNDSDFGGSILGRVYDARANELITDEIFFDSNTGQGTEVSAAARLGAPFHVSWTVNTVDDPGIYTVGAGIFGDINLDANVDALDLLAFSRAWQREDTMADLTNTGDVTQQDALVMHRLLTQPRQASRQAIVTVEQVPGGKQSATMAARRVRQ